MKAIFETGGKQYYAEEGTVLYVEKLDAEAGSEVVFDRGASVKAKVLKHGKNKKIKVFKYNAKKNYRKTQGHRQPYTKIEVISVK